MKTKIYISGPISAKSKKQQRKNLERFFEIEDELHMFDVEILNPARWEEKRKHPWRWYMTRDFKIIKKNMPTLYMMIGWKESRGAIRELELAVKLGLPIMFEEPGVDIDTLLK